MKSTPIVASTVARYSRQELVVKLNRAVETMRFRVAKYGQAYDKRKAMSACEQFVKALDGCSGGPCRSVGRRSNPLFGGNGQPGSIAPHHQTTGPGDRE